jgi:hypothetical protein
MTFKATRFEQWQNFVPKKDVLVRYLVRACPDASGVRFFIRPGLSGKNAISDNTPQEQTKKKYDEISSERHFWFLRGQVN